MILEPRYPVESPLAPGPRRAGRLWRPADVAVLVAVICYGAAMLMVAAGLVVRLVR